MSEETIRLRIMRAKDLLADRACMDVMDARSTMRQITAALYSAQRLVEAAEDAMRTLDNKIDAIECKVDSAAHDLRWIHNDLGDPDAKI